MAIRVQAPANIAFIKYWGRTDHGLFLPANSSVSMTLSGCNTVAEVELLHQTNRDQVYMCTSEGEMYLLSPETEKTRALYVQIERIRQLSGKSAAARVVAKNNFPADAGLASSASSFCAITGALLIAYGLEEVFHNKPLFSRYVRLAGSGSAVRSVYGGFVLWDKGGSCQTSVAKQLADEHYWSLVDVIAMVHQGKKRYSSSFGHEIAESSPLFLQRVVSVQERLSLVLQSIAEKDFTLLGHTIEADSDCMHAVMRTSAPSLDYWTNGTREVIDEVFKMRSRGIAAYYTMDAGANVHVLCQKKDALLVYDILNNLPSVLQVFVNRPVSGAHIVR